ncbi:MAG: MFS transporter [Alphaproteobacteria bacterium]|nr:MFS transporter [Alphaproteobacteria bacterium]
MFSKDVRQTLHLVWPLMLGLGFIMVGNGLQGTLLSLRAYAEEFPLYATGLVMSAYYLGYLVGCVVIPKFIASVGHIRVFAAFASLASTTILLQGLFVDPWLWGFMRAINGISFVALFIVAESWLNIIAPNKLRAQIFSTYLFVINFGLFAGQFLINIGSVEGIALFILISVLISLSFLPITLANKPAPGYEEPEHLPVKKLFSFTLLPLAGVFVAGITGASLLTMGPIFASNLGLDINDVAIFMAAYIFGASTIPLFIGWVSDHVNRRFVIILVALVGTVISFISSVTEIYLLLVLLISILGGCTTSLYSICIAHMNDRLKPSQFTSASATLLLINGVGCCIGPLLCGLLIDIYGNSSMLLMFSGVFFITFILGTYRAFTGEKIRVSKQGDFVAMPIRSSATVMQITEENTPSQEGSSSK